MRELADHVWQLSGKPQNGVNVYVIDDVLIDSGMPFDRGRILTQISGHGVTAHALTHGHPDHYGSSHAICEQLGLPLWAGADDVEAIERGKVAFGAKHRMLPAAKAHPVARALAEGDTVGSFTVLHTPGHSPGHVSYWRESDRTLICGDVLFGHNPVTGRGGPRDPFRLFSPDPPLNRASARRLAQLNPELVLFGHGPPLKGADAFSAAVAALPA